MIIRASWWKGRGREKRRNGMTFVGLSMICPRGILGLLRLSQFLRLLLSSTEDGDTGWVTFNIFDCDRMSGIATFSIS